MNETYRDSYHVFGFWGLADLISHRLHLPKFIRHRICDRFDASILGDRDWWTDDDEDTI